MNKNKKMPTYSQILEQLEKISLFPLKIDVVKLEPVIGDRTYDAILKVSWNNLIAKFAAELKSLSTPQSFQVGLDLLKNVPASNELYPLLIIPYLNEQKLQKLAEVGISGLDLCGNCIVSVPDKFSVYRTGNKNLYKSSAPIKNIYRKKSSMVSRIFLRRNSFSSVNELSEFIEKSSFFITSKEKRNSLSLATISKALKVLEQELIISRRNDIQLLQADKLMDKLEENYDLPVIEKRVLLKVQGDVNEFRKALIEASRKTGVPIVATGRASTNQYAVMQRGNILSVYCTDLEKVKLCLTCKEDERFPNLELIETVEETVYFDRRETNGFLWASPVQVYLELVSGDKRDQETADSVKKMILKEIESDI